VLQRDHGQQQPLHLVQRSVRRGDEGPAAGSCCGLTARCGSGFVCQRRRPAQLRACTNVCVVAALRTFVANRYGASPEAHLCSISKSSLRHEVSRATAQWSAAHLVEALAQRLQQAAVQGVAGVVHSRARRLCLLLLAWGQDTIGSLQGATSSKMPKMHTVPQHMIRACIRQQMVGPEGPDSVHTESAME